MAIEISAAVAAIGAAVAIAGAAIGTAMVQASVGSAGIGLLAEKPDQTGIALMFLVIPETLVIFGFVIAILILLGAGFI
jgi:V/A-type H+-transporting ATPase subunit K